jgi:predicted aspartyl protease
VGEIKVRVTLKKTLDEMLRRRGKLRRKKIRSYEADAVVDTGAVRSVIPPFVLKQLGALVADRSVASYADGRTEELPISEPIVFDVMGRQTQKEAFVSGEEILIGQTILEKLDLLADCKNNRVIPNPAHPDQPVNKLRRRK